MTEKMRWTVRGVSAVTIDRVAEVADESGYTFGEIVDEAVATWFDALPVTDEVEYHDGE